MHNNNRAIAEAYYAAMAQKDAIGIAQYLHPAVHFVSLVQEQHGKEAVLAAITGFMGFFQTLTVRAVCGSDKQAMVAYDVAFPAPIGTLRTAALLTIQENLIVSIELFFDGRPLERKN